MTEIITWEQGMEYTFKTRHSWKHGGGKATTRINCNHFTKFAGADYPLRDISRKFIKSYQQYCEDLEIPGSTINRRVTPDSIVSSI